MCTMLYMASDSPLPENEWNKDNPAFFVTSRIQPSLEVRRNFSKQHVYYVGSHQRCGCAFGYDLDYYYRTVYKEHPDLLEKALGEQERGRENIRCLREYLEMAVAFGPIELYAVAAGSLGQEPKERLQVGPSYFGGDSFWIGEDRFIVVRKDLSSLGL